MDSAERRATHYATSYQSTLHGRSALTQPIAPLSQDRYMHTLQSPVRTEMARSVMTRPYGSTYGSYGYQDQSYTASQLQSSTPIQGVDIPYTSYVQDGSRSHQIPQSHHTQQHYQTYPQTSMLPPVQHQSVYDTIPQYQSSRQATAAEVMASQFTVPSYVGPGDQHNVGLPSSSAGYLTSQPEQSSYSLSISRSQGQTPFGATAHDYVVLDHAESQMNQESGRSKEACEQEMKQFDQQVKSTFDAIVSGQVNDASEKILGMSRWLLNAIVPLGLHHDNESKHEQRLIFWRNFNHCWEGLGQKQKQLTELARKTRQEPNDILSADMICHLVDELILLCDALEQYGLVDYELGVWEEQIVGIFIVCLDLLPADESPSRVNPSGGGNT